MNGVKNNDQRKDSVIKTLAIFGFVAVVVLAVWLAVQVVQLAPSAFTSLASMAERVHGTPGVTEITVTTEKTVVNTGENVVLTWNEMTAEGVYEFDYECTTGVAAVLVSEAESTDVACDTSVAMTGAGEATVVFISNEQRFIDVPYRITFTPSDDALDTVVDTNRVTVVNASIPLAGMIAGVSDDEEVTAETPETETEFEVITVTTEPEVSEPSTPTVSTPATPSTPTTYTYTYELPVSDPNGFVDLAIKYLGVGEIKNDNFVPRADIDNDTEGAVRFSVTNLGTKTSDRWTYEVLLPSGETYKSGKQAGLKPNETATIVLGTAVSDTGTQPIAGEVIVADDIKQNNNDFDWSVKVTN